MIKIAVVGTGYVGLANAVLLAQHNEVVAFDINAERVATINRGEATVEDAELELFLREKPLNLVATTDKEQAYKGAEFIVVATPTNYDPDTNYFDTSTVEAVAADASRINPDATVVIKSTIPVGFTRQLREKTGFNNIVFSPEFLREGKALYDNLHPSRIVVGDNSERGKRFAQLLLQALKIRTYLCCIQAALKQRPSSCSPIPTWPCAWLTSMNWIPTPKRMIWTRAILLRV